MGPTRPYGFQTCILFFIHLVFLMGFGYPQYRAGSPYIRNYSAKEYNASAQNWAVVQDKRGVLYFGNTDGVLVFDSSGTNQVPTVRVRGPIDIVGAGDSTMAGIVTSLCCGATNVEAATIGNLVASITVQQIGTTGTATRDQVKERYRESLTHDEIRE